jgi:multicomponent Na+:H+ antiporter subunit G
VTQIIAGILVLAGSVFVFIAALGVFRLPDVLNRMHASTKAGTLGAALLLGAVALHFNTTAILAKVVATILFLMLTAPIAAHMIGRATVQLRASRAAARNQEQRKPS